MLDFTPELMALPVIADREREARAIARAAEVASSRRGLRAGFASRLARLALAVHREAAASVGEPALGDGARDPRRTLEIQGTWLHRR